MPEVEFAVLNILSTDFVAPLEYKQGEMAELIFMEPVNMRVLVSSLEIEIVERMAFLYIDHVDHKNALLAGCG